jgi:thiol-disulfide isomerase/thioredoxin
MAPWRAGRRRTSDQGRFTIKHVPYGKGNLGPMVRAPGATYMEYQQPVRFEPGQTARVKLGGRGRLLLGRVSAPPDVRVDLDGAYQRVGLRKKSPHVPDDVRAQGGEALAAWRHRWLETDQGRAWDASPTLFAGALSADGAFRFADVTNGSSTLLADLVGPVPEAKAARVAIVGQLVHDFVVPEIALEQSDEPLDLGRLTAEPVPIPLQVGNEAPEFEAPTLDGRTVKLTALRGKVVLLEFWATWCGPCLQQVPKLTALYDKFAQHQRFVMLGISVDRNREKLVASVRDQEMRWPQVFLEEGSKTPLAVSYRVVGIPTVVLVGPDGPVLAFSPPPAELSDLIAHALAAP